MDDRFVLKINFNKFIFSNCRLAIWQRPLLHTERVHDATQSSRCQIAKCFLTLSLACALFVKRVMGGGKSTLSSLPQSTISWTALPQSLINSRHKNDLAYSRLGKSFNLHSISFFLFALPRSCL